MFRAIIVSNETYDRIFELIEDKVVVYPGTGEYRLLAATEEEFPKSLLESLESVKFDTGYQGPVHAYEHYFHDLEDIPGDVYWVREEFPKKIPWQEFNRALLSMKTKLNFTLTEMFTPNQLYFKLLTPPNEVHTRYQYYYQLYYNDVECQATEDFMEMFRKTLQAEIGPLMVSSWTLDFPEVPRWYLHEIFRDLIELGEIDLENLTVITGVKTGALYLFYKEPINLLEENINRFITNLKGQIRALMDLKIFPRNTPVEIIRYKELEKLPNGQWKLPYEVPSDISPFENLIQKAIILKSSDELFWFLAWLTGLPNWTSIESNMKIYVEPNQIRVIFESKRLREVIQVTTAGRVRPPSKQQAKIYYPKRLSASERKLLSEKTYIQFYDMANQELCMVVTSDPEAVFPEFEKEMSIQ